MQKAIIDQVESGILLDILLEESPIKTLNLNIIKALVRALLAARKLQGFVKVPTQKGFEMFRIKDIVRIETHSYFAKTRGLPVKNGDGNSTHIYTIWDEGHFRMARKVCDWKKILGAEGYFVQTHQSHLINLQHVRRVYEEDGLVAEMINGDLVPVAERYRTGLINRLIGNWGEYNGLLE